MPPAPAIICVLATLPETYFTLAKEKELNGYVVSPIPKDYYYLAAYNTFKSKLSEIIREENSPYTIEKNRLNSLQNKNLEKLLDKIITVEAKIILQKQNEEHRRAVFSGKVIKLKSMEDIKTVLRKKYVDDNNKPDYDRIVPRAEHLGFNISVVEKIKDAQKIIIISGMIKQEIYLIYPKQIRLLKKIGRLQGQFQVKNRVKLK